MTEDTHDEPLSTPLGWRRWLLRSFVVALLLGGLAVVAAAAVTIARDSGGAAGGPRAVSGVRMPDDRQFRDVARQLLARRTPERLAGMTVVGAGGKVTVLRYREGSPSFLSSYLNPNALAVITRAIAARGEPPVTIGELRLEVIRATGRQRWRMRGNQSGALWRATINPNGTDLRVIASAATAGAVAS